jgi:hypothetical protein
MLKEFIQFCENHSIIALYLFPYIIHIFQSLDISVFASLVKIYKKRVYDYNIYENRVEITINCSTTAKKINNIIEKIRKDSRDSLLLDEFCNTVIKVKIDYTLAYKICDDMIDALRRQRRAVRSRKDCEEAKYLTVIRIEAIKKKSAAADKVKRKEKEKYWALYDKGKLTQLI